MSGTQIIGLVLLAVGLVALVYGGFTYTEETHDAEIGPLDIRVEERETFEVPPWVGVVLIVAGAAFLVLGMRRGGGARSSA